MEVGQLVDRARGLWWSPKGLLLSYFVIFLALGTVPAYASTPVFYWVALGAAFFITTVLWYVQWRSVGPKGKVRVGVAIYCDKKHVALEVEEDLIKRIRALIREGRLEGSIHLVKVSASEAQSLESIGDLRRLLKRKRLHFLLFGSVRTRGSGRSLTHHLNFRCLVTHKRVGERIQHVFQRDIDSVFPSGLQVPAEDQLPQFQDVAEWISFSSKYIIGVAAAVSGDLRYAESMMLDIESKIDRLDSTRRAKRALESRVRERLKEIYLALASQSHAAWVKSHGDDELRAICECVERSRNYGKLPEASIPLGALACFLESRDVDSAEKVLRSGGLKDAIVPLDLAFFAAWRGDFGSARKYYRRAFTKYEVASIQIEQIESFFDWLSGECPEMACVCDWCLFALHGEKGDDPVIVSFYADRLRSEMSRISSDEIDRVRVCISRTVE